MPPQVKISKEQILDVAIQMVRKQGIESVNARSLAAELHCSIHPIFTAFETMENLKMEIRKKAEAIYDSGMMYIPIQEEAGFHQIGMQYINFAKTEKNLFRLLFMSNAFDEQTVRDIVDSAEGDDELIKIISQRTQLSVSHAREAFTAVWLTTHGIATLFATNNCQYSDTEITRILSNTFSGIVAQLKKEEKN